MGAMNIIPAENNMCSPAAVQSADDFRWHRPKDDSYLPPTLELDAWCGHRSDVVGRHVPFGWSPPRGRCAACAEYAGLR